MRPNIRIPDFGELNWPIHVPDSYQVADAKVSLTGLYHPHASDLRWHTELPSITLARTDDVSPCVFRIQLRHEEVVVDVTNGCAGETNSTKHTAGAVTSL